MGTFREYMTSGREISGAQLDELILRCEWFTAARIVRAAQCGAEDRRLQVTAAVRALGTLELLPVSGEKLTALSSEDMIERFLREEDLRIVASEGEPEGDIRMEAEIPDEDDLVSEELAEIYLAQGLRGEALATYRKLSLRNPEKSVYFAELINKVETK